MAVKLLSNGGTLREVPTKLMIFPGGEPHVQIQERWDRGAELIIDCRFKSNDDLMTAIALTDAARRLGAENVSLFIPYFPGARQDRVKRLTGESLTCKVYADIINSQGYDRVIVVDPHSDVTPALLDRVVVISQKDIFKQYYGDGLLLKYNGLIAPDAGARKKVEELNDEYRLPIYYGAKHRDMATGKLSHFSCDELPVGRYLLTDDICDGGGTFVGLANAIENWRGIGLDLFVTHGILSKGTNELLKVYDNIVTTDSVYCGLPHEEIEVIKLLPIVRNLI